MTGPAPGEGPGALFPVFALVSEGEEETLAAGRRLAPLLARGELVLLDGDLGSGKTLFVRGLAEGLGADPAEVSSPTFALVHEYGAGPGGAAPLLAHADLYRLEDEASRRTLAELGLDELRDAGAVLAVEWPRPPLTEEQAVRVSIEDLGAGRRRITVTRT